MAKSKHKKEEDLKRRASLSSPACYMEEFPEYFGLSSEIPDGKEEPKQSNKSDKE